MMHIRDHITPGQHNTAKAIGHALVGGDADAWHKFSQVIASQLSLEERAALGWAVMRSVDFKTAGNVFRAAVVPEPLTAMECAAIEYRAARGRAAI